MKTTRITRSVWLCTLGLLASAMVVFAPVGPPGGVNIPSGGVTRAGVSNIVQGMMSSGGARGSFSNGFSIGTINASNVFQVKGTNNALLLQVNTNGSTYLVTPTSAGLSTDSDGKIIHSGTTNTWGNAVVPFNRAPNLITNMAADLTITGITGFREDVLNTVFIRLNANGADRVLAVPASWGVITNTTPVNTFTNLTTATIANGTRAWLMVEALIGVETNAYLLPAYY